MARISKAVSRPTAAQVRFGTLSYEQTALIAKSTPEEYLGWRYIHCAGYDTDAEGKRHFHHQECIACDCPPGPQENALVTWADEVALLGGAGSSKTEATFGFILKGNSRANASGTQADISYCSHKNYSFLVLRQNSVDLDDWFNRFRTIGEKLGAKFTTSPMECVFPSGARGYFGHLADPESYKKYMGKEFVRIVLEEASHIPDERLFIRLKQRNRTSHTTVFKCQMMLTANPIGPGVKWLNARYRFKPDGRPIKSGALYKCPFTGNTRTWIHSTAWDNPYFLADQNQSYLRNLEGLKQYDEIEYKRMALGDFDCVSGAFFPMFRKERRSGEPENAVHVIAPKLLPAWWNRAIGVDWGYKHPAGVVRSCWSPEKQLICYREAKFQGLSTLELGAEIARLSASDLQGLPSRHMTVHLSHDCFARDGRETEAEQIARGMNTVLGAGAVFVVAPNESEENLDPKAAWEAVKRRQSEAMNRAVLTLMPAGGGLKRRHGFSLMREYMRWQPLISMAKFDEEYAMQLMERDGALAYLEYKQSFDKDKAEKLPVLQIFNTLPHLIANIEAAQEDPNNIELALKQDGDDLLDAGWMVCHGFGFSAEPPPRDVQVQAKLDKIGPEWDGVDRDFMRRYYEAKMAPPTQQLFVPRLAGPSMRRMRAN